MSICGMTITKDLFFNEREKYIRTAGIAKTLQKIIFRLIWQLFEFKLLEDDLFS